MNGRKIGKMSPFHLMLEIYVIDDAESDSENSFHSYCMVLILPHETLRMAQPIWQVVSFLQRPYNVRENCFQNLIQRHRLYMHIILCGRLQFYSMSYYISSVLSGANVLVMY